MFFLTDRVLPAVDVPVLHDRVRRVGVDDGPVLPRLSAVGRPDPGRSGRRLHHHRPLRFLLLRHRPQHSRPHLPLRQRRGTHNLT